jgi:hypothetical protein
MKYKVYTENDAKIASTKYRHDADAVLKGYANGYIELDGKRIHSKGI